MTPRSVVLLTRPDLADEMLPAMDGADACIMRGHGVTAAGATVEQATVLAINFNGAVIMCSA